MLNLKPSQFIEVAVLASLISINCANALASNPVAGGSIGIRLVQIPDSVKSDPRSGYYIVANLVPNEVFSQQIEVSNSTGKPAFIKLYPAAATNVDGVFLPAGGTTANELTSWTLVSPSSLILPSNSSTIVTVTITVPAQVTPTLMYGVVWASDTGSPNSAGITSTNRVGIRMYDQVGPPPQPLKTSGSASSFSGGSMASLFLLPLGGISLVYLYFFFYRRQNHKDPGLVL